MGCAWLTADTRWEHSRESQAMAGGNLCSPLSRVGNKMKGSHFFFNRKLFLLFFWRKARELFPGVIPALSVPYMTTKHSPGFKIYF